MQAFKFKKNQLLFHDFNNTAMGWALPAAIAGSLARNKKKNSCYYWGWVVSIKYSRISNLNEIKSAN